MKLCAGLLLAISIAFSPLSASALVMVPAEHTVYLSDIAEYSGTTLYSIDAGALDPLASAIGSDDLLTDVQASDYDPVTGLSYDLGLDADSQCALGELDVTSGKILSVTKLWTSTDFFDSCSALTIDTNGQFRVTVMNQGDATQLLGLLDPVSGEIVQSTPLSGDMTSTPGTFATWLAADPTTENVLVGSENGDVYSLDSSNGNTVFAANMQPSSGSVFGADFDSWGRLWFTVESVSGVTELWSATPDDNFSSAESMGQVFQGLTPVEYRAIFLIPYPSVALGDSEAKEQELAATGQESAAISCVALAALVSGLIMLVFDIGLRRSKYLTP